MKNRAGDIKRVTSNLYDVENNDPDSQLINRSNVSSEELSEISQIMGALGRLRDAEQKLSEASQAYMKLGKSDMRALHFLIVAENTNTVVTPSAIAAHLGVSTASTTKLLDRLEDAGHVVREAHPNDRRALVIKITAETRKAAIQTVGRVQAKRFNAAARLSSRERMIVISFIEDMIEQIQIGDEGWSSAE